jgi:hypothetical protein
MQTNPAAHALLANPGALRGILSELQGVNIDVVAGAAAGTAMNIPAIRVEDTIVQAIQLNTTWSAPLSDKANITIQPTKASATLTISGDPIAAETITVNGNVYTWRVTPTKLNEVKITSGNNTTMATALAAAINAYEGRYESQLKGDGQRIATLVATSNLGVVTVTSVADGVGNAPQVTGTVTVLAASGTNTGSATLTPATVIATNTAVVNGVTFTAVASGATDIQFNLKASNLLQGIEIARAINAYQFKYGTLNVSASANATTGVVTITPFTAPTGNAIALSEASTNVAASGAYLAGGTATGSIKSTTNLSAATLVVFWYNKQ